MAGDRHHSRVTTEAARLLGLQIREARARRRWTQSQLADRIGVSTVTVGKIERGDLSVALGTALEAAVLVGVPLFTGDADARQAERRHVEDRLALLPRRVRDHQVDDDF
jgi:transcriptional regulator with XRE-family HTH domain